MTRELKQCCTMQRRDILTYFKSDEKKKIEDHGAVLYKPKKNNIQERFAYTVWKLCSVLKVLRLPHIPSEV